MHQCRVKSGAQPFVQDTSHQCMDQPFGAEIAVPLDASQWWEKNHAIRRRGSLYRSLTNGKVIHLSHRALHPPKLCTMPMSSLSSGSSSSLSDEAELEMINPSLADGSPACMITRRMHNHAMGSTRGESLCGMMTWWTTSPTSYIQTKLQPVRSSILRDATLSNIFSVA